MKLVPRKKMFPLSSSGGWLSLAISLLIALIAMVIYRNIVGTRLDFYNELWAPAHLFVNGSSPYDTSSLNTDLPAVWLPMGVFLFSPFGWLDERSAALAWFIFNIFEILVIVFLALKDHKSAVLVGIASLLAYFFPPVLQHFALGQFSITTMLCIMLSAYFVRQQREWTAAFFLALGCTKHQLGFLFCFLLLYAIGHQWPIELRRKNIDGCPAYLYPVLPRPRSVGLGLSGRHGKKPAMGPSVPVFDLERRNRLDGIFIFASGFSSWICSLHPPLENVRAQ